METLSPVKLFARPRMFQETHLFVEMLEFQGDSWQETRRWNHGLQEDVTRLYKSNPVEGKLKWTAPHLPHLSLAGMLAFRKALVPELMHLDVEPEVVRQGRLGKLITRSLEQASLVQACDVASLEEEMLNRLAMTCRVAHARLLSKSPSKEVSADLELSMHDPVQADAEEESALILVDEFPCLSQDVVCMVRFSNPVVTGLEETKGGGVSCTKSRVLIVIAGPPGRAVVHVRLQIGEVAAALLQDDAVVRAIYTAANALELFDAFDEALSSFSLLPRTTALAPHAIRERAETMAHQLSAAAKIIEKNSGDASVRAAQNERWTMQQSNPLEQGFSVAGTISVMQTMAVPLLLGIVLALLLANVDAQGYQRWVGAGHSEDDSQGSKHHDPSEHPTMFGLSIHGHGITLNFIVNDIFMVFFFGLAAKEITEAFQPGGSLYPPTRSTVNVLAATLGGVVGPVITYLALVSGLYHAGMLDQKFSIGEYAIGWGIPTATDISLAWVSAVSAFGAGHPAINYLLLLAIIDDGIGLVIIAVAYPDPAKPVKPIWLLLILLGMLVAFSLRRLQSSTWQSYVFLAGPPSWIGLLYAGLHPSLALVFIVPFIPLHIEDHTSTRHSDGHSSLHAQQYEEDGQHASMPLHEFQNSMKLFVDFVVLFGFGAANAGIALDGAGPITAVVLLSLIFGKTLGIFVLSMIACRFRCPPPIGMGNFSVLGVGFIASTGLTVALFVSGQAFSENPELAAQAKMGALLSILVAGIAILGSMLRRRLLKQNGETTRSDSLDTFEVTNLPGSEVTMEELIVKNVVSSLHQVHQAELAVEKKTQCTRRVTIEKLDELDVHPKRSREETNVEVV